MNYGKHALKRRSKTINAKGVKIRNKIGVWIGRIAIAVLLLVAVVGVSSAFGVWKGVIESAPDISSMDVVPTGYSTTVLAQDGTEVTTLVAAGANRKYVTIDQVPKDLQHAFVAIEDERFYQHNGIDLTGIVRAFVVGVKKRNFSEGASTITQQLIKNNVLTTWTSESSFIEKLQRKIQEQFLAVELEKQVKNKDWILENYMNSINLGSNTLGVQAASMKYFGKDVSELSLSECTVIAAITQNPSKYNPITHPDKNKVRREKVLNNMKTQGYITKAQFDEAVADPVYDRIAEYNVVNEASVNSYFVDAMIENIVDDLKSERGYSESEAYKALYQGGLTIHSTQDLGIQAICDEEVNNPEHYSANTEYSFSMSFQIKQEDGAFKSFSHQTMLAYYKEKTNNQNFSINYASEEKCREAIQQYEQDILADFPGAELVEGSEYISITLQPQAAFTVMDNESGEVRALVGGRGDKAGDRTWNRASDMTRQPGSTFKIMGCFAAALDAGNCTLATVQDNAPYTVGSKTYKNSGGGSYTGYTTIREAIKRSYNIVTVKTLEQIGVDMGYEYALKFGFTTLADTDRNLGLCLGGLTYGVSNLELTAAYAAVANHGVYQEPKFYSVVYDHDGNVLLDKRDTQETHEVVSEQTAWLLTDAMKDVLTGGTGVKANFGTSMAKAGKSGTTTSNRDNLFAGYTPYYTCVVWGGYDDNSISNSSSGYPKLLWKAVMGRIHENLEAKDFDKPDQITTASVCLKSGLLPQEDLCSLDPRGNMVATEYFAQGTVPKDSCHTHIALDICTDSGQIANEFCPKDKVEKRVYVTGAAPGSGEGEYNVDDTFTQTKCSVHSESNRGVQPGVTEPSSENPGGETPGAPTPGDSTTSTGTPAGGTTPTGGTGAAPAGAEPGGAEPADNP